MSSFFSRLKQGLSRSRDSLAQLVPGGSVDALSEEEWLDIEDGLIMADCGGELSGSLVQQARKRRGSSIEALKTSMLSMIPDAKEINTSENGPFVLLVVGVNGTGKTTTIGKLATMFGQQGKSVLVGAGDTFRAAAVDQLAVWVERAGADMVRQHDGADPASVAFDTVQRGVARNYDVVIVDTAGRVQTDRGLMDELAKVRRVISKAFPGAPHEVWQVVDGGTGQNAVVQVEKFREVAGTTGLIVTKLDGSGKGGIVLQLSHTYGLPIRYVGVGETLEDLMPFNAEAFITSLLPEHAVKS
ncbi:signal recognition particle-docking protein FtsY [Mariprofundus sp. EBB-1]|uniref:signal recognition particle-docking protein FtsY n=1 Tax=Mariprofundus sp. EBB-1 TaxID=2650971 RepID=UPI000EF230D2|nr:signal recognition particle-docking protein FtsY [Mariprofundus sp. EBB-1]RLL52905.1 signal recognition particle-docking protein FtsY [Mariprofundus sp. EBB-1]